jgi:transposase
MRPHGTQEQLEERRRRALHLLDEGANPPDVAHKIGCSLSSVYYWDDLRETKGENALKPKPVSGRPGKLTGRQKQSLVRTLVEGPLKSGYSTDLWTLGRVAKVIDDRFGVIYHPGHVWKILKELGLSRQKPETRARERDEKEIAHWKRHKWPHIKKVREA